MTQYVVIGTSPFVDCSVAVGPFRLRTSVEGAENELTQRGYNVETCELLDISDVEFIVNDKGALAEEWKEHE